MLAGLAFAAGLLAIPTGSDEVWHAPNLRLDRNGAGQIYFQLLVAPDRTIEACHVVYSDFVADVGTQSCQRLMEAEFERAATDAAGEPVHGFFVLESRRITNSFRANDVVMRLLPDFVISVDRLPAAHDPQSFVTVIGQVSSDGRLVACEQGADTSAVLGEAVCTEAGTYLYPIINDRDGRSVPYVRELRVKLEEAQP